MRRIEIDATKGSGKKNGFMWRVVLEHGKKFNVLYFAIGYDTYGSAIRAAKAHNKHLIVPLPLYHRDELIK